jgi:RNA recognition motif-containing protein
MRGQAFVVFDTVAQAEAAKEKMNNKEFWGRPMVVQFAMKPSDATVAKQGDGPLEVHKEQRLEAKSRRQKEEEEELKKNSADTAERLKAKETGDNRKRPAEQPLTRNGHAVKPRRVIPDESLPPNNILFLQNLPSGVQESSITPIFDKFPGFVEVRLFSVRHVGFVEYQTEQQAVIAKESTAGVTVNGEQISVTYAKK